MDEVLQLKNCVLENGYNTDIKQLIVQKLPEKIEKIEKIRKKLTIIIFLFTTFICIITNQ